MPAFAEAPVDAVLARLLRLHPKIIDLSLDRMTRLLARLGNPERALPPVVHVAGTNGKGSVVAFLEAMARAEGLRVDAYVSPHLVRFNERIRLDGAPIAEDALLEVLDVCERVNDGTPITFFEITTAAAFVAFARDPADLLLLEVGLGGRLDATNVIARPALSVVTPVSIDHTQYLGDTLGAIAGEKAGILKAGVPAVIATQAPEAAEVIGATARGVGAPLFRRGIEWSSAAAEDGLSFSGFGVDETYPLPALAGPHQCDNAATAIACAHALDSVAFSDDAIAEGLRHASWPGRLQRLAPAGLRDGWELWLDGGHNEAAGEALGAVAAGWRDAPLHLIVGMLNTKPPSDFLRALAPSVTTLTAVPVPGTSASAAPEEVRDAAEALGLAARCATNVQDAIATITAPDTVPGRILVCGSLYLVGSVLATLGARAARPQKQSPAEMAGLFSETVARGA